MQVLLTKTGTPYIEVNDNTRLIFSKSTANNRGYKFMVVSHKKMSSVCISGAKAKKKRYVKNTEDNSFTVRLADFKRSDTAAFTKGVVSPITLKVIKKLVTDKVDEDGIFPYSEIETLNDELVQAFNDPDEEVDEDPTATESYDDVETIKKTKKTKKVQMKTKPKAKIRSSIKIKGKK